MRVVRFACHYVKAALGASLDDELETQLLQYGGLIGLRPDEQVPNEGSNRTMLQPREMMLFKNCIHCAPGGRRSVAFVSATSTDKEAYDGNTQVTPLYIILLLYGLAMSKTKGVEFGSVLPECCHVMFLEIVFSMYSRLPDRLQRTSILRCQSLDIFSSGLLKQMNNNYLVQRFDDFSLLAPNDVAKAFRGVLVKSMQDWEKKSVTAREKGIPSMKKWAKQLASEERNV